MNEPTAFEKHIEHIAMMDECQAATTEPIYTYTTEHAIEDGVFCKVLATQPHVLTAAVYEAIDEIDDGRTFEQKAVPLLMDALMIVKSKPRTKDGTTRRIWTKGLKGNVTGRDIWIGLNDIGGITLMFPEDY